MKPASTDSEESDDDLDIELKRCLSDYIIKLENCIT